MKTKKIKFRLTKNRRPASMILNNGARGTLAVDIKRDGKLERCAIRHCSNENSILIIEQSDFAKPEPIIFKSGYLFVEETQTHTLKFLKNHSKKNRLFEEVNTEIEAKDKLERGDLIIELSHTILMMGKQENGKMQLETLAGVLENSLTKVKDLSVYELRDTINKHIEENPYQFVDRDGKIDLFNEETQRRYIALHAISRGVIDVSRDQKRILWGHDKKVALNIPTGIKPSDYLTDYFVTDEGMLLLDEINNRINKVRGEEEPSFKRKPPVNKGKNSTQKKNEPVIQD